jgi:hypothetical protein
MGLFTDGAIASIEELKGYDSQLLIVATVEGIDVTRKLALAHEELAMDLAGLLDRTYLPGQFTAPLRVHQIVVTPEIKLWYVFRTLEMVYGDAYNSQLNDRYAGKRDEYHGRTKGAYDQVIQSGLGMVTDPVSRAAAPVTRPAAGSLADGAYFVAIAWTNAAGEEGASSEPAMVQVSRCSFAVQTTAPPNVKGWNVYGGTSPMILTLQNVPPLAPKQTWVQPDALSTTGRPAGRGQKPNYRLPVPRMIQRG